MIRNYLKIASRILVREKLYSIISILGLVTGVTASLLILLFVADELSYDRFHPDAEQIHRVTFDARIGDQNVSTVLTGLPLAEALQNEAAGIKSVLRMDKWMTCPARFEDRTFTEMNLYLADSNFFSFFNYELLEGNPAEVLKGPNKIVISENAALRYFDYKGPGDESPIGKTMLIGSTGDVFAVVTGIAKNPPKNAHFAFDFLMSLSTPGYPEDIWVNTEVCTYFKLNPGSSLEPVQQTLNGFVEKYCAAELKRFMNITIEQLFGKGGYIHFNTQRLVDIHLHSAFADEYEANSDITYVYLFTAIALMILILACINFMNLATARASMRAKEVGVRKSIGAARSALIRQFMVESGLYTFISFALSYGLTFLFLKPFNSIAGKELSPDVLIQPNFIAAFILLAVFVTIAAGSYPAFYLTGFKPATVLKGKIMSMRNRPYIRNGLVVFQFFISISLIISSIMIYEQIKFLQDKSLGFEKDNIVGLMHTMNLGKNSEAFRNEILQHPEFVAASFSNRLPPDIDWNMTLVNEGENVTHLLSLYMMDHDHMEVMGFKMKEGRFFSRDFKTDTLAIILNETAARQMGIEKWEGKKVRYAGDNQYPALHIIGIVKDFNYTTLKSAIRPLAMVLAQPPNWGMAVRLTPGETAKKIELLGQLWKKFLPDAPFEYNFVDTNFNRKFASEQRAAEVMMLFTALAIFIACMGLFGLATFMSAQRTKEIGVRKVLGATVGQILFLLSRNFIILISFAFLLAVAASWYGLNEWLQTFAYRIDFDFGIAVIAGASALLIALLVVSLQSARAARENPVKSLRTD